jgi:hypothetical protein
MNMIDERDFDWLAPEFFANGTEPQCFGATADDMWKMQQDPLYTGDFLKKQRQADRDRDEELMRRRTRAILEYQQFAAQDNGYYHCPENANCLFRSLRNGKSTPQYQALDYTVDGFRLIFELAKKHGLLELGPNRGYTKAQIDRMSAQEERDLITYPKRKEVLEEEAEIRNQRAVAYPAFRPSNQDREIVYDALRRSGKITLSGLMTLLPAYTREQCAAVADSIPDLNCIGTANRRVWWIQ